MQRRLFLLLLSTFSYASESVANSAAWNCEQSKDGKEWVCSGDTKSAETASSMPLSEPAVVEIEKPLVKEVEKSLVKEVTKPRPVSIQTENSTAPTPGKWQCDTDVKSSEWNCQQTQKINSPENNENRSDVQMVLTKILLRVVCVFCRPRLMGRKNRLLMF